MECSNFGCAVLGNKVYVVGGALVDDRGCSAGEFPETVHPFGFAFDPISEVGLLVKVLKIINPTLYQRNRSKYANTYTDTMLASITFTMSSNGTITSPT